MEQSQSGSQTIPPKEYNISRYVPGLTESAVNIFKMEFDPKKER